MSVFPPSLWEFSLSVYAQPEMEHLCLWLQDHRRVNVNTLLWALWLDEQQVPYDADLWHRGLSRAAGLQRWLVIPLRCLRRRLPKRVPWLRLRAQIKRWELNGERRQLQRLQAVSDRADFTRDNAGKGTTGSENYSDGRKSCGDQTPRAGYVEQVVGAGDTYDRLQQIMNRWRQLRSELPR